MKKIAITSKSSPSPSDLYKWRYVLLMLSVRDIKLRYKQTLLGISWVVLQPLLTAALFAFIFGSSLHLPHTGQSYLLFAYAALIPWMTFSQSLQRAGPSIVSDAKLITKVYFPRLFIPLSATFGIIIDYLIAVSLGYGIALYESLPIIHTILWLPLATLHLFLFCSGINILIAGLNVHFRDLKHIIPFLIQLGVFVSPIVYPLSAIPPKYLWLYQCNPLVGIIEFYRFLLIGTPFPTHPFTISCAATLLLALTSLLIFQKMEGNLADIV